MKKTQAKARPKAGHRARGARPVEFDRGWHELEAQHDRLKTDWMSLAVQLGIGGPDKGFAD